LRDSWSATLFFHIKHETSSAKTRTSKNTQESADLKSMKVEKKSSGSNVLPYPAPSPNNIIVTPTHRYIFISNLLQRIILGNENFGRALRTGKIEAPVK
jgi:hypothetical protein